VTHRLIRRREPAGVAHLGPDDRRGELTHTEQFVDQRSASRLTTGQAFEVAPQQVGFGTESVDDPQRHLDHLASRR
jgi:hypothetical protein